MIILIITLIYTNKTFYDLHFVNILRNFDSDSNHFSMQPNGLYSSQRFKAEKALYLIEEYLENLYENEETKSAISLLGWFQKDVEKLSCLFKVVVVEGKKLVKGEIDKAYFENLVMEKQNEFIEILGESFIIDSLVNSINNLFISRMNSLNFFDFE